MLNELENGHHTAYFNCESVLYEYLSKEYKNEKFVVDEENLSSDGYKKYIVSFQDTDKQLIKRDEY